VPLLHLAQVNVGTLRQPTDHPAIAEFADALDPVNAADEASSGFVWRLQDETGACRAEALGLHARSGFTPIPCSGEYAGSPFSRCLGKPLAAVQ
jgi:hypothetical protein